VKNDISLLRKTEKQRKIHNFWGKSKNPNPENYATVLEDD
jgi:hypothetical protein